MDFNQYARQYHWLRQNRLAGEAIHEIARHLPPSAARLRLLDIGCGSGAALRALQASRPDIVAIGLDRAPGMLKLAQEIEAGCYVIGEALRLPFAENSMDAVLVQRVYFALRNKPVFLKEVLRVLRPGGRLIMVDPAAGRSVWTAWREFPKGFRTALDMFGWHMAARGLRLKLTEPAAQLEFAGYARILTETILHGWAILSRGEKPHERAATTFDRVAVGAAGDRDAGLMVHGKAIHATPGRFIHLLIRQNPNKPLWKLAPDEVIRWEAAAVHLPDQPELAAIAFASLPKAVSFMQTAVMEDAIHDINKVAKFSKATAAGWDFPILLNPTLESVRAVLSGDMIPVDPASAESPEE